MVLTLEVIEESPFADIGGFGDVLDRDTGKTAFRNKLQGGSK